MIKYLTLDWKHISDEAVDKAYIDLLNSDASFTVIKVNKKNHILTKEGSFFETDNLEGFIKEANNDIYFKTVECDNGDYSKEDLALYFRYLNKHKERMTRKYGDKYLLGSVAVRTKGDKIITTIRGKENFNEFTIISTVDYANNTVYICGKKATLNAPLLFNLFKNNDVKAIVHINHQYDDESPFLPYAFPGTVKDSLRDAKESFNISHHGLFWLFDDKGNIIRSSKNGN